MGLPLLIYRMIRPLRKSVNSGATTGIVAQARPNAPFVWIHAPMDQDRRAILSLIADITETDQDTWFLVTTDTGQFDETPDNVIVSPTPADDRKTVAHFLEHWRPDCCVWLGAEIRAELNFQTQALGTKIILIDTGKAIQNTRSWRFVPGLLTEILGGFAWFLVGDAATQNELVKLGVDDVVVEVLGVLDAPKDPPSCNMSERDELSDLLAGRPVWLAACVNPRELPVVLGAHRNIVKRTHRLLLIIVPDDYKNLNAFRDEIKAFEFDFGERENADEPTPEMQVYLADTDEELGLWYRLASVSFMGQTLVDVENDSPDPFAPAALGSAIVHGPGLKPHGVTFQRLARAGAAIQVTHSGELVTAIDRLLSPANAAALANAAWEISTSGAEVQERAADLIIAAQLGERF